MSDLDSNEFLNEVTLSLLISKSQLQKLNKLRQNDDSLRDNANYNVNYNRDKISDLFNQLLNNNRPNDLLEDVKSSFDNFIEKSIYYLEIHDKNVNIQNERNGNINTLENIKDESVSDVNESDVNESDVNESDVNESDVNESETNDFDIDKSGFDEFEDFEYENEEYFEEPKETTIKVNKKNSKKTFIKNGVDDIQKLPLDWFNTTRQAYKVNQIIPRKKETVINNNTASTTIFFDQKIKI